MLENLRIVLIGTSHNGNIGSTARAMKTMGISDLVLVEPKSFDPNNLCDDATAMASGATDLLQQAKVVSTFEQAIEDCAVVMGASARSRIGRAHV